MNQYVGQVVIAERIHPTKEYPSYQDGRFLIHTETDNALYGVPLATYGGVYGLGGYPGDTPLPLTGDAAYRIAAVEAPEQWMLDNLDSMDEDIRAVLAGEKKGEWIISVYYKAQSVSRTVRSALTKALAQQEADSSDGDTLTGGTYVCSMRELEPQTVELVVPHGAQITVTLP